MSDGMVERANRTVKDQLAKFLYTRGGEGDDHLQQVEIAYNTTVHSSTEYTPFFEQLVYQLIVSLETPEILKCHSRYSK